MITIWGMCVFHSETGTEGGYWAIQDVRGIIDEKEWSYYGLLILHDGDRLTIFNPETWEQHWSGEIKLTQHDLFTEDASGMWIHADQEGMDRDVWAQPFFDQWPCFLETDRDPWVVGGGELAKYQGILTKGVTRYSPGHSEVIFMSDGTVRWDLSKPPDPWGRDEIEQGAPFVLKHYVKEQNAKKDSN